MVNPVKTFNTMKRSLIISITTLALVCLSQSAVAQQLLAVDMSDRVTTDTPDTVAGFSSFLFSQAGNTGVATNTTRVLGAYSVSLAPFDDNLDENSVTVGIQNTPGVIDDRDRATPTNSGSFTYSQIYDDFIFANTPTGPTGGMDLSIGGGSLQANSQYLVFLYAFDSGSTALPQPRTANWLDGNNANALVLTTSFSATNFPTTDFQYRFTGLATTDENGILRLLGRNTTANTAAGAVSPGVFLNGFEVHLVPEPSTIALGFLGLAAIVGISARRRR